MTRRCAAFSGTTFFLASMLVLCVVPRGAVRAQQPEKTVADGVFTEAQAVRGYAAYDAACSQCHRADLAGGNGPALRDERFTRNFAEQDLKILYTKIATTMPRAAAGSLGDNVYLDIVAHVLKENGFPAGNQELTIEGLGGIRVLPGRPKPPPPVGDFSYVEAVGCLVPGPGGTWLLTNATEPVSVVVSPESAPVRPEDAGTMTLGDHTFRLLDALAYSPEQHKGHKMYVRGLFIKLPTERRMTISTLETLAPSCNR
jgi:S-disulfanyl-L-cysteine oxidoreductase SoxD